MIQLGLAVRGWSVPKINETRNDDCWGVDESNGRIAIADGVGTTSYCGEWAEVLVRGFVEGQFAIPENEISFEAELIPLRERWWGMVPWERLAKKGYPFDWKAKQGSFSTLLGMKIEDGAWSAFVIGDCNLFVVTYDGRYKDSWPAVTEVDFGNLPTSIRSVKDTGQNDRYSDQDVFRCMHKRESPLIFGDCIVICTDALSAFLLGHKHRSDLWWNLLNFDDSSQDEFARWIDRLRGEGLKNDDTTAVVIETLQMS